MSKEQLLKKAHAKHMQGKFDAAVKLYNDLLRIRPDDLDANYLLGTLYAETGELSKAREYLEKAGSINPASPYIKVNLGNIFKVQGEFEAARECYMQALALNGDLPQAYFGLGNILETVDNDLEGAFQNYRKALQLNPNDPTVLQTAGRLLFHAGDKVALEYFQTAARINPRLPDINRDCGIACMKFGRKAEGARYLRQALLFNPSDTEASYYLSIAEGKSPDKELQQEYVRVEFDRFAPEFDHTLVERLEYLIPGKMVEFLRETFPGGLQYKSVADLGCGTGLFGIAVRKYAEYLAGMDISTRMIELATQRNCYDALFAGELIATLRESDTTYDLFAATDVLIYIGDLEELFATLTAKAMPGALFAFSTEICDGDGFILQNSGRFAHSRQYVQRVAETHSCRILASGEVPLRTEFGSWINGDLYIIRLKEQ